MDRTCKEKNGWEPIMSLHVYYIFPTFKFCMLPTFSRASYYVGNRDVKLEPAGPAPGPKSSQAGLLRGLIAMLPGSCRTQNEWRNAKRIYRRA